MSFMDTLTEKHAGMPTWAWAALLTLGFGLFLRHKKATANPSTAATTAAAANTSTDLGSASEVANLFNTAGLMPYQGGATYVNTTQTIPNPPAPVAGKPITATPTSISIGAGNTLQQAITAGQKANPAFSWASVWSLNPNIAQYLRYNGKPGDYTVLKPFTLNIGKAGTALPSLPAVGYYIKNAAGQLVFKSGTAPKGTTVYTKNAAGSYVGKKV